MRWSDIKDNPRLKKIYDERIKIIRLTREFFWSEDFLETETPIAVRLPGQEPYLSPMPVEFHTPDKVRHKFYLHTSPEFAMKKLLAAGYKKIFQITKCFRDYESFGGTHNPEFTMIEWYRAPGNYGEIMDDTEKLFKYIGSRLDKKNIQWKNNDIRIDTKWDRKTMKDVWKEYVDIDLDDYLDVGQMKELCKKMKLDADGPYEDLFYKIFLNKIEPYLGMEKPVFIYDYPAQMCSLSRSAKDPRYAERFELYIGGLELANAFGELTDAVKQNNNLEEDRKKRKELGREIFDIDVDFINALKSGIPPIPRPSAGTPVANSDLGAGGIALGIDRMIMLFTGAKDINEVIFQSAADQIDNE